MYTRRTVPPTLIATFLAGACAPADQSAVAEYGSPDEAVPAIIPVSSFFDNPEIAGAQISPDGEWLSYLKAYEGKLNVFAKRIGSDEEIQLTDDTERPVTGYFWAIDASKILYVQDKGGNENFHIYAVPVDGTATPEARDLTPYDGVRAQIFAVPTDAPDRILVGLNRRNPQVFDAYWLDLESGDLTMVAENPGRHGGYLIDHELRVRVALGQNAEGGSDIFARDDEASEWRLVASYPPDENVNPIQFHKDNRRLYISSDHGDVDLSGLVLMDLATGETEEVERDPSGEVDFGSAIFSNVTDELIGTAYVADTTRIYFRDDDWASDFAKLRAVHAGSPNVNSSTLDERTFVVSFNDPIDPGATYLFDRDSGDTEFLFRPRPWLEGKGLADMQPVSYQARDGLTIHGYLTTPRGMPAEDLPMILVVHGGPWARDTWGYQPEVQLLANRGYAVLQINYRGSTGYGKSFLNAAVGEWAGAMHDDLVDGVEWAVAEGIADPERVGIYGGSYGGYATLVGLTFTPEVFACGLDYVGPSSLVTLIESFPAYWRPFLEGTFYRHVGDPADVDDLEDMQARSPLNFVGQIEDPIMIVQGANDPRVTQRESDQMAIALRDRGIPVTYLLAENEGHGFANADNRMALYRSMEVFFGDCLGGRVDPDVDPAVQAQIDALTVDVDRLTLPEATSEQQ
ncbi:MAG: S9 family peptidase [Gemmatimonadetes bacterium]|nr:S9 family peptidase [Gemmatimonadota bacterium]